MKKIFITLLILILSFSSVFADVNETEFLIEEKTGTGLDSILDVIENDPGLIANVAFEEILEAMFYSNKMNFIIVDSIIQTNIAADGELDTQDMKTLNNYINTNFFDDWTFYHGDDEGNGEETGYHLVQNDGATTQIEGKNAVNTVIDGIYHLGFPQANENQVENEDGNANAKYSDLASWMTYFLASDLNGTSLVGDLEAGDVKLEVQDEFDSNEIQFSLSINNEIFDMREISIMPSITCLDVKNTLSENEGILKTSILSSKNNNLETYNFKLNTQDLALKVPWEETCLFAIELKDEYKTNLILVKPIIFKLKEDSREFNSPSISGTSSDVVNYMDVALLAGFDKGYNSLSFTLKNYENKDKKFSISFIAQDLNLAQDVNVNLAANSQRKVNIPFYVKKDENKGLYPIRLSVSNGDDKKTKYSYIKIN